tara:strand:+ start:1359 stop:1769 length:411 start_codon:yes stop_codon:yes gene_type:complete
MGTKITAKYSGMCKTCGETWNVGQDMYYQKQPKAMCTDLECFTEQGGTIQTGFQSSFKPSTTGSSFMKEKTKFVMPDVEVPDSLTVSAEVVIAAIKKGHDLAHLMYPDLDTETQLFGTIRSKLADQILYVWSKKVQ